MQVAAGMGAAAGLVQAALAALGYDPRWLEYGFLDERTLLEQLARYEQGEDRHTEHYRCAAFRSVLDGRPALDDVSLGRYIELAKQEEDPGMARSALCELIAWPGLTDGQLDRLSEEPLFSAPLFQKLILRRRLLLAVRSDPVDAAVFSRCLASNDAAVQRELVEKPELTPVQLERLAEAGANRAIRNRAKARLRLRPRAA